MLEGVTLGGFGHVPWAPVTGYLAFGTVILYFVAIGFLPRDEGPRVPEVEGGSTLRLGRSGLPQ